MKKRITSITLRAVLTTVCAIILCAVLAVFVLGVPNRTSYADETVSVWDGDLAAAGWDGAQEAPEGYVLDTTAKTLEIGSAAALAYFSHEVYVDSSTHALDGYTVTLTKDIDLNNKTWAPIGSTNRKNAAKFRFSGVFNGNGHTISNFDATEYYNNIKYSAEYTYASGYYVDVKGDGSLKIPFENDGGEFAYGLFGVTANMTVNDLTVSNVKFDFSAFDENDPLKFKKVNGKALVPDNVGAIIGYNAGSLVVNNCVSGGENDESVIKVRTDANPAIGGLVGRAYGTKQTGSTTLTTFESISVTNSTNYINSIYEAVPNTAKGDDNNGKVSGILGYATSFKNLTFDSCVNYGNIDGGQTVGGIMAYFADGTKNNVYEDPEIRKNNAWVLTINNCVNYGNLTSSDIHTTTAIAGEPNRKYVMGKTYTGGIMGILEGSSDNNKSIHDNSYDNKGKLASVNYYITNCLNYGDIKTYNTEAKFYADQTKGSYHKGYNAAGGIIGMLMPSESGENRITNNFNYGDISTTGEEGREYYTPRLGGYIGKLTYYWDTGTTTVNNRPIDLDLTGGSSGTVTGEKINGENRKSPHNDNEPDDIISIHSLVGDRSPFENKVCDINLIAADGSKIYREKQPSGEQAPVTAAIAADVAAIGFGEYFGQANLTKVNFADNGTLTSIGEWAFAGTGLTQVDLPESVSEIGTAAFCSGVYVIAKDKAHYDALQNSDKVSDDIKSLLTYAVTVEYYDLSTGSAVKMGEEQKLCGQPYTVAYNDNTGLWANSNITYVGLSELGGDKTTWYGTVECTDAVTVQTVAGLLSAETDTVKLYTRTVGEGTQFIARDNLVYGNTYELGAINALLAPNSKRVTTETVAITAFNGSDENPPTAIRDAGTYTVEIGGQEVTIVINPAPIELSAAGALQFSVNGSSLTDGPVYIADGVPSLIQPDGDYTVQAAIESLVRVRGEQLTLNLSGVGFTANVKEGSSNSGTEVGQYTTEYTITADANHVLRLNGTVINGGARGLTVTLDDGVATVTKVWYIVQMGNWLVDDYGNDYAIADRVYGSSALFAWPNLYYGNSRQKQEAITYTLTRSGYESVQFVAADFVKYLNNTIPVGSYTLRVAAPATSYYEEYDEDGNPIGDPVEVPAFAQDITFEVTAATLSSDYGINDKLNGVTFGYLFGETGTSSANAATVTAINSAIENIYRGLPTNNMTVWDIASRPVIEVNLASDKTNVYSAFTLPGAVGVYTYNYRISIDNYNVIDRDENGALLEFTLVAYGVVELPVISSLPYNGSVQTAAVPVSEMYRVIENVGGVDAGSYDVVLRLLHPEYYIWANQTLTDHTAAITMEFVVSQTTNYWSRLPNIVNWSFESFDPEINRIRAIPNYIIGSELYFKVATDEEGEKVIDGLGHIKVDSNGKVTDAAVIGLLNSLTAGSYYLISVVDGTPNYTSMSQSISFNVSKAFNSWADGDDDLVLPGWIVGKYKADENAIVVNAAHGKVNIVVTDIDGNEYYNSVSGLNKLDDCAVGKYLLKAWVDETENFAALAERTFTIEVYEKTGLAWWAVLLIVIAALAVAALVLFILWKKGVFQILTEKVVVAIRTRASIDATIASVRAAKKEDEVRKLRAQSEAKQRAAARRAAAKAEKELPTEERAAALEAKAQAQVERAEKMRLRAEAMQARAARMREQAQPEQTEQSATEQPAETPQAEAAATETTETPTEE